MPACFVLPCKRSISLAFSNNLRLRAGSAFCVGGSCCQLRKVAARAGIRIRRGIRHDIRLVDCAPCRRGLLLPSHPCNTIPAVKRFQYKIMAWRARRQSANVFSSAGFADGGDIF